MLQHGLGAMVPVRLVRLREASLTLAAHTLCTHTLCAALHGLASTQCGPASTQLVASMRGSSATAVVVDEGEALTTCDERM